MLKMDQSEQGQNVTYNMSARCTVCTAGSSSICDSSTSSGSDTHINAAVTDLFRKKRVTKQVTQSLMVIRQSSLDNHLA